MVSTSVLAVKHYAVNTTSSIHFDTTTGTITQITINNSNENYRINNNKLSNTNDTTGHQQQYNKQNNNNDEGINNINPITVSDNNNRTSIQYRNHIPSQLSTVYTFLLSRIDDGIDSIVMRSIKKDYHGIIEDSTGNVRPIFRIEAVAEGNIEAFTAAAKTS